MSNFTALGSTQRIISQIDHQSQKLLGLAVSGSTSLALKLLSSDDLANIQSRRQIADLVINATTIQVTGKQHYIDQMGRAIEVGSAGALILLTSIQQRLNHSFRINVILAEISGSIGALERSLHAGNVNVSMDGIQLVIQPDRADLILSNLAVGTDLTTVTDHDSRSQFLVQIHTVNTIQVLHHIEVLNIDDVVTIKLTLYIHGLRISRSVEQLNIANITLLGTLLITLGTESLDVTQISLAGTDTGDRALMNLLQNLVYPPLVSGKQFGSTGTNILVLGEQGFNTIDAMSQNTVRILLCVDVHSSTKTADAVGLSHRNDACLVSMRQNLGLLLLIVIKDIMFHCVILLIGFRFVVGIVLGFLFGFAFESLCDKRIHDILLLLGHGIDHISNRLLIILLLFLVFSRLVLFGILLFFLFLRFILGLRRMRKTERHSGIDDSLIIGHFAVLQHRVDKCTGVSALMHQTHLANTAMQHIRTSLLKLIGVNGQSTDVTVLNKDLRNFAISGVIEKAVGVNTFLTVLKPCMTENIARTVVLMIPDQRDFNTVVILKGVPTNYSSIRTLKVVSGCPAAEITSLNRKRSTHFEFPPYFFDFCLEILSSKSLADPSTESTSAMGISSDC